MWGGGPFAAASMEESYDSSATASFNQSVDMSGAGSMQESKDEDLVMPVRWATYLSKCVPQPCAGYAGSLAAFSLADVAFVGGIVECNLLNDTACEEHLGLFNLRDGRFAVVWISHCPDGVCPAVPACNGALCVYKTLCHMSDSLAGVIAGLTPTMKALLGIA